MRSYRIAAALSALLLLLVAATPSLHAGERGYFTVSGGWSWPMGGPVEESYQPGFTLATSFRAGLLSNYLSGFEVGYTWLSLDSDKLASSDPGVEYSGGDMGILSITTENDYLAGREENALRPFLNLGLGFFRSFIDDATVSDGSTSTSYSTGVYKGSFFGFHGGIGALINRDRFGLRIDANYNYLFAGGPDLEFFSARAGIVFYLQGVSAKTGADAY
jgi:hypothetical protein